MTHQDKSLQGMVINTIVTKVCTERMSETMEVFIDVSDTTGPLVAVIKPFADVDPLLFVYLHFVPKRISNATMQMTKELEPTSGVEPLTCSLRVSYSTN